MSSTNPKALNIAASFGLFLGAVFGMAGTMVVQSNFRSIFWGIDGAGLVMATSLLTLKYFRKGCDSIAAGFLVFAIGEGVILSGAAMSLTESLPSFAAGTALWATGLVLISVPREFAELGPSRRRCCFDLICNYCSKDILGRSVAANGVTSAVLRVSVPRAFLHWVDLVPAAGNQVLRKISNVDAILGYHSRTKHHLHRFAASSGYLDWATQPDPFRTFAGAERVALRLLSGKLPATYEDLYIPDAISPAPVDIESIGVLFELSLGLSAWKQYQQTRWALRCNPSSGNLHPTEGYAILPPMPGLGTGGAFHYASHDHELERRATIHDALPPGSSILIGLTSIHWREAWKYGERAFRYCQHDIGHAIAAVRYAAAALGWSAIMIEDVSDATISDLLGLAHTESFRDIAKPDREHPGALLRVGPRSSTDVEIAKLQEVLKSGIWSGRANSLSSGHVEWTTIDEAAEAAWKNEPGSIASANAESPPSALPRMSSQIRAAQIIKQRRSAVALDDITSMTAEAFYVILDRLLPRPGIPPWDAWPWPPCVHCAIFVHRIEGLHPGLYLFERNETAHEKLRKQLDPSFVFKKPDGCPVGLRLFQLADGDFRYKAQVVSCQQKIAGAGAFSLGMLAEFDETIHTRGAWWYRRLFWESGMLGHVLYLEAEAAGVRGTGIGCYFDDVFHDLLGLKGNEFQSLYHFTIGGPIEDTRLMTLPGYAHLER